MPSIERCGWFTALLILSACFTARAAASPGLEEQLLHCAGKKDESTQFQCYKKLAAQVKSAAKDGASMQAEPVARAEPDDDDGAADKSGSKRVSWQQRLSADEPNYISLMTTPLGDERGDETHAQFFISQKVPLWPETVEDGTYWPRRGYFIYNGLYDFYLYENDSYSSSPVLSRRQNPGLVAEWDLPQDRPTRLRLGWFHESNGQTLEEDSTDDANGELRGIDIFNRRVSARGEDYALASVSRGWDYASIRLAHTSVDDNEPGPHPSGKEGWYQWQMEYRWFCDCQGIVGDREDDIWWEPGNHDEIEDFDGLRFMAETALPWLPGSLSWLARMELKTGTGDLDALSNITYRPALVLHWKQLNVLAFYFNGYGKDPSTYHLDNEYFGLGFEFR